MSDLRRFDEAEIDGALRNLAAAIDYPPTPDLTNVVRQRIQSPHRKRTRLGLIRANHAKRSAIGTPSAPPVHLTVSDELPQRRLRSEVLLALGGALVVLVVGMVYMLVFTTSPGHRDQATAPVAVEDTLIANDLDRNSDIFRMLAYLPGGTAFQPVLDNGSRPVISPDGRQLFSPQVKREGDTVHIGVVALSSDSLAQQWQSEVASFPTSAMKINSLGTVGASVAVTADRVYICPNIWGSHDPLTIVVLDRESGRELTRWSIPLNEKNALNGATIYASPDGNELWLLDSLIDPGTNQNEVMLYLRVDAMTGRLVDKHKLVDADGQSYYPYGRLLPDGHTLSVVGYWAPFSSPLGVSFFDLSSGALETPLILPLAETDMPPDHEETTSPDGRTLYILLPALAKVMIVDLPTRSVTQVVPVQGLTADGPSFFTRVIGALRGLVVQPAAAKFSLSSDMQLSQDGRLLYAVGITGSGFEAVPSGIVAIDTTTWRVTERWLTGTQVKFIQLGRDGSTLYVQAMDDSGMTTLTVLDTRTGVANEVAQDVPSNVTSLSQLYRERYGKLLNTNGGATTPSAPRARLDAAVDRTSILSGDRVTVDARFVDPLTGTPVSPAQNAVVFDPPSKVTATFFHGQIGKGDVVVELQADGYGHYRGSAALRDPAAWSLRVDATREQGPGSRAEISAAVVVQAAVVGTDGRRYLFQLTTDPVSPVVGQVAKVRAAFVDAERGTPLPDDVELVGGTPTSLEAAYFLGLDDPEQSREVVSTELQSTGHGVYTDRLAFNTIGSWTAQINVQVGTQALSILVGTIQVAAP